MIKLIIVDFDGTLVDTYEANYLAYQKAFENVGMKLEESVYKRIFGFRFDDFMSVMSICEEKTRCSIREYKKNIYSNYFDYISLNESLVELLKSFKSKGGIIALASTARRENLFSVLKYFDLEDLFDWIQSGDDVKRGKPNPEIYDLVMSKYNVKGYETLIFEDSEVGIEAAKKSGANVLRIVM